MDQRERTGDLQEGIRAAIQGFLATTWTALPGIVETVNLAKSTCTIQPTIQSQVRQQDGSLIWKTAPLLIDVPIVFPCAGGFALTLPIQPGDEVLVIIASRCIDLWWQTGKVSQQGGLQLLHDLSDGFAIPGPKSLPNVLPNISANTAQLRSADGSTYIEIAAGGVVNIVAPGGLNINGAVVATGEGTFNGGHTVSEHVHGGVTAGSDDTAPPTG